MLYDTLSMAEVVDGELAAEFLKEATRLASSSQLEDTARRLEQKSRVFGRALSPLALEGLDGETLGGLTRMIFGWRRRTKALLKANSLEALRAAIGGLLYGTPPVEERFQRFVESIRGVEKSFVISLASELLHYTSPGDHWMWTYWIWDPRTKAGALPLVLAEGQDVTGESDGRTYANVGQAVALVDRLGRQQGFTRVGEGPFGTHVFLASVYAVYMYTVFEMRLSKEFNRVLPELPEFTRRVLGVHQMELE